MPMKGKRHAFLTKADRGSPTKKGWKTTTKTTCVYEGQSVHMKGQSEGFSVKLIGCPLRKRLENHQKSNFVLMKGNMCP